MVTLPTGEVTTPRDGYERGWTLQEQGKGIGATLRDAVSTAFYPEQPANQVAFEQPIALTRTLPDDAVLNTSSLTATTSMRLCVDAPRTITPIDKDGAVLRTQGCGKTADTWPLPAASS
jgi:hypothetical protein